MRLVSIGIPLTSAECTLNLALPSDLFRACSLVLFVNGLTIISSLGSTLTDPHLLLGYTKDRYGRQQAMLTIVAQIPAKTASTTQNTRSGVQILNKRAIAPTAGNAIITNVRNVRPFNICAPIG